MTLFDSLILGGDIGGTKINLGLFKREGDHLTPVVEETFPSKDYAGLDQVLDRFLSGRQVSLASASFGVASPIVDGHADAPNLHWRLAVEDLRQKLKIPHVDLINDLEATALAISALPEDSFAVLNAGGGKLHGDRAVIAAGTGLGEAALVWGGAGYRVIPSEGGHGDFAPRNALEIELLKYLLGKFERVSYERVLSGPGLHSIYMFLREYKHVPDPAWLTEQMSHDDPSSVITQTGLAGRDALCVEALEIFISVYGAEAGNLALKFFATGGVFIGGGIAPRILPKLKEDAFMKAFTDKGRLSTLLSSIPVRVILDPRAALFGAAYHGLSLLQ